MVRGNSAKYFFLYCEGAVIVYSKIDEKKVN